jgi:hypothetical protein
MWKGERRRSALMYWIHLHDPWEGECGPSGPNLHSCVQARLLQARSML